MAVAKKRGEATFAQSLDVNERVTAAFVDAPGYTRMPGWHAREPLGRHLIARFGLDEGYCEGEDLSFVASEALARLSLAVGEMLEGFLADPDAEWERDALPQLNDLHAWAVCVFLGTDVLDDPPRRLCDFIWLPLAARPEGRGALAAPPAAL